jgi:hypothetical protein
MTGPALDARQRLIVKAAPWITWALIVGVTALLAG